MVHVFTSSSSNASRFLRYGRDSRQKRRSKRRRNDRFIEIRFEEQNTTFSFSNLFLFSFLDLATEAEAQNTFQTLLNYRIDTYQMNPLLQEINKIQHCLTILYFLARDYVQVHESMNKIKDCTIKEIEDDQQRILKFLDQLGQMKALMKRQQQQN